MRFVKQEAPVSKETGLSVVESDVEGERLSLEKSKVDRSDEVLNAADSDVVQSVEKMCLESEDVGGQKVLSVEGEGKDDVKRRDRVRNGTTIAEKVNGVCLRDENGLSNGSIDERLSNMRHDEKRGTSITCQLIENKDSLCVKNQKISSQSDCKSQEILEDNVSEQSLQEEAPSRKSQEFKKPIKTSMETSPEVETPHERDKNPPTARSLHQTGLQDFISVVRDNIGINSKILIHCQVSDEREQYLLLWVMDRNLSLCTWRCSTAVMSTVMKVLYSYAKDKPAPHWDNDLSLTQVTVSKRMFLSAVQHMREQDKHIPAPFRTISEMQVSYLVLH